MTTTILRRNRLTEVTALSMPTLYRKIRSGEFPAPVRLSANAVGWLKEEVDQWLAARPRAVSGGKQ